jgi:uncharacterized membrane protein
MKWPVPAILRAKPAFEWTILFLMVIGYVILMTLLCFRKYHAYEYTDFDLAIFDQALWNTLHGRFMESTLRYGIYFKDHFSPVLLLMLPFYFIYQSPLLLLFLQSLFLGLGAIPLSIIGRRILPAFPALALCGSYLCYPAMNYLNLFEFHPECAAPFLLLTAFAFYQKDRFLPFIFLSLLTVMCKENLSLIVIMFSVLALLDGRSLKWKIFPGIFGAGWFIVVTVCLIPMFNKGQYYYINLYSNLGNNWIEIATRLFFDPFSTFPILFTPEKIKYLLQLFSPIGFISLVSPLYLILSLPTFLSNLATSYRPPSMIEFQYTAGIIPFVFISAIFGLKRLLEMRWHIAKWLFLLIMGIAALMGTARLSPLFKFGSYWDQTQKDARDYFKDEILKKIPNQAPVIATFEFLSHLSSRTVLYPFQDVYYGKDKFTGQPMRFAHPVAYAAIDFSDPTTFWVFYSPEGGQRMRDLLKDDWKPLFLYDTMGLFSNQDTERELKTTPYEILKSPHRTGDGFEPLGGRWSGFVTLERYRLKSKRTPNGLELDLGLIWSCQETPPVDFDLRLRFADGHETFFEKTLPTSYSILPPRDWKKGTAILNNFKFLVPASSFENKSGSILLGLIERPNGAALPFMKANGNHISGFVKLESDQILTDLE